MQHGGFYFYLKSHFSLPIVTICMAYNFFSRFHFLIE